MQTQTVPTTSRPTAPTKRPLSAKSIAAAIVIGLIGAGLVAVTLAGSSHGVAGSSVPCAQRLIVIDLSSADRSPKLSQLSQEVVRDAANSAVVCSDSLSVYGVSGGGQISPIITSDDLNGLTPIGPNAQVRSARFGAGQQATLNNLITQRLKAAYLGGDPKVTSIGALYDLVQQQSTASTNVLLITTGVNRDSQVDLNQPLAIGAGSLLAKQIRVPHVSAAGLTELGLAQVDSSLPPPSPQWPTEVLNFNMALCRASHANSCHMFDIASPTQALTS